MYAYALRPETLEQGFYRFIVNTGPVPEQSLQAVRRNVRGLPLDIPALTSFISTTHPAPGVLSSVTSLPPIPAMIPCSVIHPKHVGCLTQNFPWVFGRVIKVIAPVYLSVFLVPAVVFNPWKVWNRPIHSLRSILLASARSSTFLALFCSVYQLVICGVRALYDLGVIKQDNKLWYWVAGVVCSASVFVEEKGRRCELALYTLTRATESIFEILLQRKLIIRVPHFEVAMFSVAMGNLVAFYEHEPQNMSRFVHRIFRQIDTFVDPPPCSPTSPATLFSTTITTSARSRNTTRMRSFNDSANEEKDGLMGIAGEYAQLDKKREGVLLRTDCKPAGEGAMGNGNGISKGRLGEANGVTKVPGDDDRIRALNGELIGRGLKERARPTTLFGWLLFK
ncbi:hypothetical protein HDU93_001697 [Gonapodya sp. JEL0774]|nr:hypothetical protein HDU93_001697 [Gonapodya sp. JEL0774]